MSYRVTQMPSISAVSSVDLKLYDNILIPIDEAFSQKLTAGDLKINFLSDAAHTKLVQEIVAQKFEGKAGKSVFLSEISGNHRTLVVLYGIGKTEKGMKLLSKMQNLGGKMCTSCLKEKTLIVGDFISIVDTSHTKQDLMGQIGLGFMQSAYRFDKYMTTERYKDKKINLQSLSLFLSNVDGLENKIAEITKILDAIYLTRDLVNEPGNILYPEAYANIIKENLGSLSNMTVRIMGKQELEQIGMHMLLGVGNGSVRESEVVVMEYKGNPSKKDYDIAFVGKGVTFDTGGISIKPAKGMEDMKGDMAGSAAVVGTMKLLSTRNAKVNAVGVVGLVENMPSGSAQRPGDIVKSLSGKTVEVLNTDAEGRLVLGDILYYTQTKYSPKYMIDLATLTGAVVVALGAYYAGMYSNSDDLVDMLNKSSDKTGEDIWRMPLDERFASMNESTFADLRNVTNTGQAGSITAAEFLRSFIDKCEHWAHLDIAGVSDVSGESAIAQKGCSTAFGVKLLNTLVADHIEAA